MNKKDKFIGIAGIILFFSTLIVVKILSVYNIGEEYKELIGLVFFILGLVGVGMSRRYFVNLFEEGMRGKK